MHHDQAPRSKSEFYRRYRNNEFGNRPNGWPSWDALVASGYSGRVSARHRLRVGEPLFIDVTVASLQQACEKQSRTDITPEKLNEYDWIEAVPHHKNKLSGETLLATHTGRVGPFLRFSRVKDRSQRDAMHADDVKEVFGSEALAVLRWAMTPSSFEDWLALSERFPTAAIEFTCFERNVGIIPGRNTIIWECRNY